VRLYPGPAFALLSGLSLLSISVEAQHPGQSGIGLLGGPQLSVTHVEGARYSPALGGVVGVYFPILAAPRFELQPELVLSYQGSSLGTTETGYRTLHTLYLQLPVTGKYFFSNVINVQFGLQIGRLLMAKTAEEGETTDVKDDFRSFEAGTNLGLGADFTSGFDLSFRYYTGLTSLTDDLSVNPTFRTWRLTLGYRIHQFRHHPGLRR
jgi:hypothetical protein